MSFLPDVYFDKPKRSNVNLSRVWRSSAGPGMLIPCLVEPVYAGDDFRLDISSLIMTLPLKGPLMGSFKFQLDGFIIPNRLYNPVLHDDEENFDRESTFLPFYYLEKLNVDPTVELSDFLENGGSLGCNPSSLYHYLGVPEHYLMDYPFPIPSDPNRHSVGTYRSFNAVPLLGYWEIFRNYYANVQEEDAYTIGYSHSPTSKDLWNAELGIKSFSLENITKVRRSIMGRFSSDGTDLGVPYCVNLMKYATKEELNTPGIRPSNILPYPNSSFKTILDGPNYSGLSSAHYPCGGLALRTYLPDRFTAWINTETYAQTLEKARIDVSNGYMDMDQFRLASHVNRMLLRLSVAGTRYSDYQLVNYGTTAMPLSEIPRFIGTASTEITFDDVIQTSATETGSPLGALGGRGHGGMSNKHWRFYTQESGFLMIIMSIIPRVDYYQGTKYWNRWDSFADIHTPLLDGVGFQDLLVDDFMSAGSITDSYAGSNPSIKPTTNKVGSFAVGKQPAWIECRTSENELHGTFAQNPGTMYMTLARTYNLNDSDVGFSAYIDPALYNYIFVDASLTAQNFWVQIRYDLTARRAISKSLVPYL